MKAPARILVIDPHELMRAGIRLACESRPHLEIVGEADNLDLGRQLAAKRSPDVMILDLATCDQADLALVHDLHVEFPALRILVFTTVDAPEVASQVIAAGASGYLIKIASLDEIGVAIQCVHIGRTFISHTRAARTADQPQRLSQPTVDPTSTHGVAKLGQSVKEVLPPSQPMVREIADQETIAVAHSANPVAPKSASLSRREIEVLTLLADGLTNKQAAERMFLSVKTVETYRSRIMKKHGLNDRSELIRFARQALSRAANEVSSGGGHA